MLTQKRLKELLFYDPLTGAFTWNVIRPGVSLGNSAGCLNEDGYIQIGLDGTKYLAHRLVWLYVFGKFPDNTIDHDDHDKTNNKLLNLFDVSLSNNQKNRSLSAANTSGVPGIRFRTDHKSWVANIRVNSRQIYLYEGRDFFEACCRKKSAELLHGFHENHGRI